MPSLAVGKAVSHAELAGLMLINSYSAKHNCAEDFVMTYLIVRLDNTAGESCEILSSKSRAILKCHLLLKIFCYILRVMTCILILKMFAYLLF